MEFYACGNGIVSVVYRYPADVESLAADQEPGGIYATDNVRVGDYITLKHSPGNVVWGHTFRGWEDYSGQYDGLLQPGRAIQIVSEEGIEFVSNEKRALSSLELELQTAVNCHVDAGN